MPKPFGYNEKLPEELRDIFIRLCQDVVSLNQKWQLYTGLFTDPDVTALLSGTARATFRVFEETLRNDMTMLIGRLCDPASSRRRRQKNISLRTLLEHEPAIPGLDKKVEDFIGLCKTVEQHRDKAVAHNDLRTFIRPHKYPLPGITRDQIDEIVRKAGEILNFVVAQYDDRELAFDALIAPGGADHLIFWLRKARERSASL